ncbi:MAG: DUF4426 domain-containing protein [Gammaproteobacteria bacterium]
MNYAPNVARLVIGMVLAPILLGGLLTGCDRNATPPAGQVTAPAPEGTTVSSRDFGDYVMHFNALRTNELTPDIARNYGIVRSTNRVLLNVSIIHKVEGTPGVPVTANVTAQAVNLNGQLKDLSLREVREGDAIYYIGDVLVGDTETLTFTIDAIPADQTRRLSVKFQRDFS